MGSIIEASEDLDAILRKIMMGIKLLLIIESSRSNGNCFTVIVDFYASYAYGSECRWCGPCKVLSPLLEKEVSAAKNTILIKVDIDSAPLIAEKCQVC